MEELRKPININDNSDGDTGALGGGGGGGGGDDGTPPRPPRRYEFDLRNALNNRLNRHRYGSITLNQEERALGSKKKNSERQREIAQIPKGTVKSRKSDARLFQPILPDNSPPIPIRDDYWLPLPVVPSGNNFIKPQLAPKSQFSPKTKPHLPPNPIIDDFARPLTKFIDDKKNAM